MHYRIRGHRIHVWIITRPNDDLAHSIATAERFLQAMLTGIGLTAIGQPLTCKVHVTPEDGRRIDLRVTGTPA